MKKKFRFAVFGIVLLYMLGMSGCGVNHKTPEGVVTSLIESYAEGKVKKIRDCYGVKKNEDENLETQIDATIKYIQAHNAEKVEIQECEILAEQDTYTYVYITYNMILDSKDEYPCISTYMVGKEEKKYYVLSPEKVTEEMSAEAAEVYAEFMKTDTYKDYTKKYDTFIKKNPGYEEKIAGKLNG